MFGNGRHRIFVYALVSFSLMLFAANVAWGQQNDASVLPVVGIGGGQVLRVGIAALPFDDDGGNVLNCDATLSFVDTRTGSLVGEVRRFDLRPGEADFVDLDSETLDLDRKKRTDILPVLDPSPDTGPCEFSYSVLNSVFGKLSAYGDSETLDLLQFITPSCSDFVSPAQIFGVHLPGLGFGQTMLYTVVRKTGPVFDLNNDPLPCDITVNIKGGDPMFPLVVASLVTGPLAPGHIASVSVNSTSLGLEKGETAFLGRQVVSSIKQIPFPPDLICPVDTRQGCFTSVQIIDNKFGTTTTLTIKVFQ